MPKLKRAVEPLIAVVILVAVTLVVAIGVVGWVMGWWGTFGATETLQFYPDSYIEVKEGGATLHLHVANTGTAAAVVYKVEVAGITSQEYTATLSPGAETTLSVPLGSTAVVSGASYVVKVFTRAGNVYTAVVQAK